MRQAVKQLKVAPDFAEVIQRRLEAGEGVVRAVTTTVLAGEAARQADPVNQLLRRADRGDAAAVAALKEYADTDTALWRRAGDLAQQARQAIVLALAGDNDFVGEAVVRQVAELRRELSGLAPTPLERLLVDRVLACWLYLHHTETVYIQKMKDLTMAQGEYHQRKIERAQRQYLAAIKALAQVRRLLAPTAPAVQVNIGGQQLNVAPGGGGS